MSIQIGVMWMMILPPKTAKTRVRVFVWSFFCLSLLEYCFPSLASVLSPLSCTFPLPFLVHFLPLCLHPESFLSFCFVQKVRLVIYSLLLSFGMSMLPALSALDRVEFIPLLQLLKEIYSPYSRTLVRFLSLVILFMKFGTLPFLHYMRRSLKWEVSS